VAIPLQIHEVGKERMARRAKLKEMKSREGDIGIRMGYFQISNL
jgi:hypothetical protein